MPRPTWPELKSTSLSHDLPHHAAARFISWIELDAVGKDHFAATSRSINRRKNSATLGHPDCAALIRSGLICGVGMRNEMRVSGFDGI